MFTIEVMDNRDKGWPHGARSLSEDVSRDDLGKKVEQYTVFLVEDDVDDRHQAVRELRRSPYIYDVHSFESGDRLIEHFVSDGYYNGNFMRYMPTLIILDVHVPGTDGMDILRELKGNPMTEDIPVIILTGDTSDKVAMDAYKSKANAFITKPLKMDQVHEVVHTGWGWPRNRIPQ